MTNKYAELETDMLARSEVNAFLERVTELSRSGRMKWDYDESQQEFEIDEEPIGYPSIVRFSGNYLRLCQVRYKYWTDEDRWNWDSRIVLDFVDSDGKLLWRFPPNPDIPELYETVRLSASGVADAIREFLEKKEDEE